MKSSCYSACQKKSMFFYGIRRFIIIFTRALQWTVSLASSIQSTHSCASCFISVSLLSFNLCLDLWSPTEESRPNIYMHFSFPVCYLFFCISSWFDHSSDMRWAQIVKLLIVFPHFLYFLLHRFRYSQHFVLISSVFLP